MLATSEATQLLPSSPWIVGIVERKLQKLFEGDSVVDLGFKLRVGINMKPLLNQKALEQKQRWINVSTFGAFTDGIMFQNQAFDMSPVNDGINSLHSLNRTIAFHRVDER